MTRTNRAVVICKYLTRCIVTIGEMPTPGDLKSGDSLFSTTPPGNSTDTHPPLWQIDPAPNGNDLGHYMKSYMKYIPSK